MICSNRPSRRRATSRVTLVGLAALALLGAALPASASRAEPAPRVVPSIGRAEPTEMRLVGAADLKTIPGARLHFAFDARAVRDHAKDATGTFRFEHTEGEVDFWATGRITCLNVGGPVAVASGTVTESNYAEMDGWEVGFTVYDHGRHDRFNATWDMGFNGTPPPCMSTAPVAEIQNGNFVVRG
ncbi:hypothetical protein [Actinopolymorpha pittospori]|uniref:Uncharacterized protein n=1 Tax=Actinopolymorpha pittospori TaxID=648752 RepID=A0A927N0D1_9ACTN|nr:hypothetical protein [Actinopolymorpha pittospori]MBE1610295.1 hypothetical protein [Actinopolymorpha pittospori]